MKPVFSSVCIAAVGIFVLAGCDSSSSTTSSSKSSAAGGGVTAAAVPGPTTVSTACRPDIKVGFLQENLQALFFNQENTGAKTIADKAGVNLQLLNAADDPLTQVNQMKQLVTQKVDVIVVDPIDMVGIKPAIDAAVKAGVPVIDVDGVVDDENLSSVIATDSEAGGKAAADYLGQSTTERGTVGIVSALNSSVQIARQKGFTDEAIKLGFKIGTVVDGKNVQEDARAAAQNLLTANPGLKFAYATGEPALIGLAAAVKALPAASRPQAVGWDLSDAAVTGLKDGWLKGVVQQNPFEYGYASLNAAIDVACGRPVEKSVDVAIAMVTPTNYPQFLYYLAKS